MVVEHVLAPAIIDRAMQNVIACCANAPRAYGHAGLISSVSCIKRWPGLSDAGPTFGPKRAPNPPHRSALLPAMADSLKRLEAYDGRGFAAAADPERRGGDARRPGAPHRIWPARRWRSGSTRCCAHELVYEAGGTTSTGGRPPTVLAFNQGAGVVLVADLGATHSRLVVSDLAGATLAETTFDLDIADGPEVVLAARARVLHGAARRDRRAARATSAASASASRARSRSRAASRSRRRSCPAGTASRSRTGSRSTTTRRCSSTTT